MSLVLVSLQAFNLFLHSWSWPPAVIICPFNTFLNAIQIFIFLIHHLANNKHMIFERKWLFLHLLCTFEKFGQPCCKPCYERLFHKTIPSTCPPCHYVNKNSTTVAYKLICYFWSKGILFVHDLSAMAGLKPTTLPICILFFRILNTPQELMVQWKFWPGLIH